MNSSIQTLELIRSELLKYKSNDTPTVIDDTSNGDLDAFLSNVNISDGAISMIRGVASLRESIWKEIRVLERQTETASKKDSGFSSNAPYYISVFGALRAAKSPITSVNASFSSSIGSQCQSESSFRKGGGREQKGASLESMMIDVVADGGKEWVKLSSIKPHRLSAELYEIGFGSEPDDSTDESDPAGQTNVPILIKQARTLLKIAQSNPLPISNEIPRVSLRLTRLERDRDDLDPKIKALFDTISRMGINLEFGEYERARSILESPDTSENVKKRVVPTKDIALDLSALIALVSDTAHASLPSISEAHLRFSPSISSQVDNTSPENGDSSSEESDHLSGEMIHRNALHAQLLNEIEHPLIPHIQESLRRAYPGDGDGDIQSASPLSIKYWITQESLDLFNDILSKVSGPDERKRSHAVLKADNTALWENSRHSDINDRISLLPLCVYPTEAIIVNATSRTDMEGFAPLATVLSSTHIPGLTTHTHNLLQVAALRGHTILTANKKSVKTALRAVKTTKLPLPLVKRCEMSGATEPAVFWVVEPRSLAELMRSDREGTREDKVDQTQERANSFPLEKSLR